MNWEGTSKGSHGHDMGKVMKMHGTTGGAVLGPPYEGW